MVSQCHHVGETTAVRWYVILQGTPSDDDVGLCTWSCLVSLHTYPNHYSQRHTFFVMLRFPHEANMSAYRTDVVFTHSVQH
jgi:hypothetical protein